MSRILFDEGVPVGIRQALDLHTVDTVAEAGWAGMVNGDLIAIAERTGYEILVTTDKNRAYQNNLTGRRIAIIVLGTTQWPSIRLNQAAIREAVDGARPGNYIEISFPSLPRRRRRFTPKAPEVQ